MVEQRPLAVVDLGAQELLPLLAGHLAGRALQEARSRKRLVVPGLVVGVLARLVGVDQGLELIRRHRRTDDRLEAGGERGPGRAQAVLRGGELFATAGKDEHLQRGAGLGELLFSLAGVDDGDPAARGRPGPALQAITQSHKCSSS
nr:hypothetical protein GCM10020093_084330 [Planobispora longispora]